MSVRADQRHKRRNPCRICGGGDDDKRGHEKRCHGFASEDGEYVHCSREDFAGPLEQETGGTYAHRMHGPCRCGRQHGEPKSGVTPANDIEALYDYVDERGSLLFQVVRKPGKRFLQRRPNGPDWVWQTSGVRRVLYRLPRLIAADPAKPVFIVEGEKDVETLERLGYVATTNPGGAGKWSFVADEARKILKGRTVVVLGDADSVGRAHARTVGQELSGDAKSVRVLELPKHDVTEFVEAGGSFDTWLKSQLDAPATVDGFTVKYAHDLAAPLPPVEWLCDGYALPRACYALIAGESYSGKSLWITDLALAIAAGRDAVGLFRASQGKVLWLDYDGQGERITRTRLQRMARARGYELASLGENFGYVWLPDARLDDPNALDTFCRLFEGVSFAVIDSWRGAAPNTEEKDRGAVQKVGNTLMRVIEKTGVTPMIVDHTVKPAREGKNDRSAMHDIHGSSAKAELAQWVVMFEKTKDKPVKVIHTKERMEARTMAPFGLRYEDIERDGDLRWGLRVVHLDREQMEDEGPMGVLKAKVLEAVSRAPSPMKDIAEIYARVGGRKQAVYLVVHELLGSGRLVRLGEGDESPISTSGRKFRNGSF